MRRIGAVILAAGGSTRLGRPKQLVHLRGETLVHAAVRAAQEGGCDLVCVVTGHARRAVEEAVADRCPMLVHNEDWGRGIGSSVRLGMRAVDRASALVFLACDQPAVNAPVVRSLIEKYDLTGRAIVASRYSGTFGIPVLFDASCFNELRTLPDDHGAKTVVATDPSRVTPVEFPDGALDLDLPDDLRALRARVISLESQMPLNNRCSTVRLRDPITVSRKGAPS